MSGILEYFRIGLVWYIWFVLFLVVDICFKEWNKVKRFKDIKNKIIGGWFIRENGKLFRVLSIYKFEFKKNYYKMYLIWILWEY